MNRLEMKSHISMMMMMMMICAFLTVVARLFSYAAPEHCANHVLGVHWGKIFFWWNNGETLLGISHGVK